MLAREQKQALIDQHGTHPTDTGSPEVQIALLSERIGQLTEHFKRTRKIMVHAAVFSCWSASGVVCWTTSRLTIPTATKAWCRGSASAINCAPSIFWRGFVDLPKSTGIVVPPADGRSAFPEGKRMPVCLRPSLNFADLMIAENDRQRAWLIQSVLPTRTALDRAPARRKRNHEATSDEVA